MVDKLSKAAERVITTCMAVKPGEQVVIVSDDGSKAIASVLWEEAAKAGAEPVIVQMVRRSVHGEEPPRVVAQAMKGADVVIAPTTASITHTKARREATQAGARVASLPGITEDIMARTVGIDYNEVARETEALAAAVGQASLVEIRTANGTDLKMQVKGRSWVVDTGLYHRPGSFGNLPAGEVYVAPVEGTASGVVVVDGSVGGLGKVDEPLRLTVREGYVVSIEGGAVARSLEEKIASVGELGRAIGELGIGTNAYALITGNILEDEKAKGTLHLAVGNNRSFGGNIEVPLHIDLVLLRPTLVIDGKIIMEDGVALW